MSIAAPTGTVSLVFTDIEGSSSHWDRLGEQYRHLLEIHDVILREEAQTHRGFEVQTAGDAFFLAFASASDAVGYCLAVQHRLATAKWPRRLLEDSGIQGVLDSPEHSGFEGIRVRMGVHTGEPWIRPDPTTGRMDYGGPMCNRASRIAGAAHGGQILVSQSTWEACGSKAPEQAVVTDLGVHALRGLIEHEHIRQMVPKSLALRSFPPIKTVDLRKTNLLLPLDSFVGREREISELDTLLASGHRLVTIVGTGGMGKTRLSQHYAAHCVERFKGGVWFVDLARALDQDDLLIAMQTALDLQITGKDPLNQLADAIYGRGSVLLVLDNLEQLVDAACPLLTQWLRHAPQAHFLITSRSRLSLPGEHIYSLNPLPLEESIQLFYDRVLAVNPTFEINVSNRQTIAEIVQKLDCLSLAIELAAARIRVLSPQSLLDRLDQRFKLLKANRSDRDSRQSTLWGAIDWSWELLRPEEQCALAQCSMFQGSFHLEACEEILDLSGFEHDPLVVDVLDALLDQSLIHIHRDNSPFERFGMYESIHAYAKKKWKDMYAPSFAEEVQALQEPGTIFGAIEKRYIQYFASFGKQTFLDSLSTREGRRSFLSLSLDLGNLQLAFHLSLERGDVENAALCALALSEVLLLCGSFDSGIQSLEKVIAHSELPVPLRLRCRLYLSDLFHLAGRSVDAIANCEAATKEAKAAESHREVGLFLARSGGFYLSLGQLDDSYQHLSKAIDILEGLDCSKSRMYLHDSLGLCHFYRGEPSLAEEHLQKALSLAQESGNLRSKGKTLGNLATLYRDLGKMEDSLLHDKAALEIHQFLGNRAYESIVLSNMGTYYLTRGESTKALEMYQKANTINRENGNRGQEAIVLCNLGNHYKNQGQYELADAHYKDSLSIANQLNYQIVIGLVTGNMGDLSFLLGNLDDAKHQLEESISICESAFPQGAASFQGSLGLLHAKEGRFDIAKVFFEEVSPVLQAQNTREYAKLLCKRGMFEQWDGLAEAAKQSLREAEAIACKLSTNQHSELSSLIEKLKTVIAESKT